MGKIMRYNKIINLIIIRLNCLNRKKLPFSNINFIKKSGLIFACI